jgi:hypothetical protein
MAYALNIKIIFREIITGRSREKLINKFFGNL